MNIVREAGVNFASFLCGVGATVCYFHARGYRLHRVKKAGR